jgi:predicted amidohydrolase
MNDDRHGGCSMIVKPSGEILADMGKDIGSVTAEIDPHEKYMRTAGFGGGLIRNDEFINAGLRTEIFTALASKE